MATLSATLIPDYQASQAAGLVGVLTTGTNTASLKVGIFKIFKITFTIQTTAATPAILRFTMGNSAGTTAPAPTSTSPFLVSNQENIFEMSAAGYDSIALANLAADNGAVSIAYSIIPLSKS